MVPNVYVNKMFSLPSEKFEMSSESRKPSEKGKSSQVKPLSNYYNSTSPESEQTGITLLTPLTNISKITNSNCPSKSCQYIRTFIK